SLSKIGGLLCLGLLFFASQARAALEVRFRYAVAEGAEQCPSVQAVIDGVRARLGRDPFRDDAPLILRAGVAKKKKRLEAHIELRNRACELLGERRLDAAKNECASLAEAMILAISIAIDPFFVPIAVVETATKSEARIDPKVRTVIRPESSPGGAGAA